MHHKISLGNAVFAAGCVVGFLWIIWFCDVMFSLDLYRFGVYPRETHGLKGVLLGPLIHGSFEHLFANTLPLFILGTGFLYTYPKSARIGFPVIFLGSGLSVWLLARESYHFGASGLTHGLMFFLFVAGVLRRDRQSIALSMLVFFLYGGMIWSIFPQEPGISFESHFFGAMIGLALAIFLRKHDPAPPRKRYDWEDEEQGDEDPVIGDQWREP